MCSGTPNVHINSAPLSVMIISGLEGEIDYLINKLIRTSEDDSLYLLCNMATGQQVKQP